jgi:hypothetical protein
MVGLRFADMRLRPTEFLDFTSLTVEEFQILIPLSLCRLKGPPQSPCKLARPSLVKMLNSLGYLVCGLRRCADVMESPNIC